MKRGTPRHWKIDRLMSILKLSRAKAVGHIVMFWDWVGDYACDGNISRCQAEAASGADWPYRNHKQFIEALVQAGFVDRLTDDQLMVHDWLQHCEDYIKKRIQRRTTADNGGQNQTNSDIAATSGCLAKQQQSRVNVNDEAASTPGDAEPLAAAASDEFVISAFAARFAASGKAKKPAKAIEASIKSDLKKWGFKRLPNGQLLPPPENNKTEDVILGLLGSSTKGVGGDDA